MGGNQVSGQRTGIQFLIRRASDEMRHSNRDVERPLDRCYWLRREVLDGDTNLGIYLSRTYKNK